MITHCIGSSCLYSSHVARACVLFLISSTSPFTSSPSSSSLRSPCCSYCLTPSTSMRSWINNLRTPAEDLGSLAENEPLTYRASETFSKRDEHLLYQTSRIDVTRIPISFPPLQKNEAHQCLDSFAERERCGVSYTLETCPHRIIMRRMMNEIDISAKRSESKDLQCLRDAEGTVE